MLDHPGSVALRALKIAALGAALAACSVGPDYVRPDAAAPARFAGVDEGTGASDAAAADDAFWQGFDDPLLDRLVADAFAANHDLRIALATWDRAQAQVRGARLEQLPVVTA